MNHRTTGIFWETLAEEYLVRNGYGIILKNWYIRGGEIDIVASKWGKVICIEVKYRRTAQKWSSLESLTKKKQLRIVRAMQYYAFKENLSEDVLQFDFIGIDRTPSGVRLTHIKNMPLGN